jgi:hypothetical protein
VEALVFELRADELENRLLVVNCQNYRLGHVVASQFVETFINVVGLILR